MPKVTSTQIKVSPQLQDIIVQTSIQNLSSSEEARRKLIYWRSDKGEDVGFDERLRQLRNMWYGIRDPKTIPWQYCSNRSMRIGMAISEMLHARLYPAVWNEDLNTFKATEKNDKELAERITKLMYWWEKVWCKRSQFFNPWVKSVTAMGDIFCEGTWDIKKYDTGKRQETPVVGEFGNPVFDKDGRPAVDVEKVLRVEERSKFTIIKKEDVYLQEGQTSLQDGPVIIKMSYLYSDLERMETVGTAINVTTKLRKVLLESIENEFQNLDGKDKDTMVEVKLRNTPVQVLKQYVSMDIDRDGIFEDLRVLVDPINQIYLGGIEVRDLTYSGKRPIDCTKFNDYIDRLDEFDGLGILEEVKPLADEIDAIFNQMTDANTLSVLRPGFYDPMGELNPATITIAPNKLIPVPDPRNNIFYPDFQIATERLLVAIRTVLEFIERLTGASSYVMGKESEIVGGSGTATRTNAIVGAAAQRFSLPAQRLKEGASRILKIDLDLVQKNLPDGMESRVLGEDGDPVFGDNELRREGLQGELDAYILGDPSLGSKEIERQLQDLVYQTLLNNPLVASDPIKLYISTAKWLKAYGEDPGERLGPAPELKDFDSPEDENTLMIQGDFTQVKAMMTENHIQHITKHQLLPKSQALSFIATDNPAMAEQIVAFNNNHIQEHLMMLQNMMAMQGQQKGGQNAGQQAGNSGASGGTGVPSGMANISNPAQKAGASQATGESKVS